MVAAEAEVDQTIPLIMAAVALDFLVLEGFLHLREVLAQLVQTMEQQVGTHRQPHRLAYQFKGVAEEGGRQPVTRTPVMADQHHLAPPVGAEVEEKLLLMCSEVAATGGRQETFLAGLKVWLAVLLPGLPGPTAIVPRRALAAVAARQMARLQKRAMAVLVALRVAVVAVEGLALIALPTAATAALVREVKSGSSNMRTIRALSSALWGMVLSPGKLLLERACGSIWFPSLTLR